MISNRLFRETSFPNFVHDSSSLAEHLLTTNESWTFRLFFLESDRWLDSPLLKLVARNDEIVKLAHGHDGLARKLVANGFAPRHTRVSLIREVLWPGKPYNCATRGSLARGKVASSWPPPCETWGGWENIAAVKDRKEAAPSEEKLETIEGGREGGIVDVSRCFLPPRGNEAPLLRCFYCRDRLAENRRELSAHLHFSRRREIYFSRGIGISGRKTFFFDQL